MNNEFNHDVLIDLYDKTDDGKDHREKIYNLCKEFVRLHENNVDSFSLWNLGDEIQNEIRWHLTFIDDYIDEKTK